MADPGAGELTEHRTADAGATARPPPSLPPPAPSPSHPPHTPGRTSAFSLPPTSTAAQPPALSLSLPPHEPRPCFSAVVPPLCAINPVLTTNHPPAAGSVIFGVGIYLASRNDLVRDRPNTTPVGQPARRAAAGRCEFRLSQTKRCTPTRTFTLPPSPNSPPAPCLQHGIRLRTCSHCAAHSKCIALSPKGSCAAAASFRISSLEWPGRRQAEIKEEKRVARGHSTAPRGGPKDSRRQVLCLMRNAGGKQRPAPYTTSPQARFMQKVVACGGRCHEGAGGDVSRVCTV